MTNLPNIDDSRLNRFYSAMGTAVIDTTKSHVAYPTYIHHRPALRMTPSKTQQT